MGVMERGFLGLEFYIGFRGDELAFTAASADGPKARSENVEYSALNDFGGAKAAYDIRGCARMAGRRHAFGFGDRAPPQPAIARICVNFVTKRLESPRLASTAAEF
jgi:hypothetical protein